MDKCCWDLVKFLVFIINFAALLGAGLILGGAIYVLIDSEQILGFHIEKDLSPENPTAIYFSLLLIVIVIFGFLFLFTFLGCCGSACQNRCMLGSFIIILFIFLGANIAAIALLFTQFPNEVELAANELEKTIPYYKPEEKDSLVRYFWDWVQPNLQCCGATSYQDWMAADLPGGREVPASCCFKPESGECVYTPGPENAYLTGCLEKVELPYRIVFWALPSIMGLMLIFSLIVCSKSRSRDGRSNANKNRNSRQSADYSEDTGYVYRASATPEYPTAPPYNPDYPPHQNPYVTTESYPTGVIPPNADYRQPLIQPPSYHDVINRPR